MNKGGSGVVFWHDDYLKLPHDQPLAISFVQAVALDQVRPLRPGDVVEEKTVCKVEVEGTEHKCLVLIIEPEKSLAEQFFYVAREKKYLEGRGMRWMAGLQLQVISHAEIVPVQPPPPSAPVQPQVSQSAESSFDQPSPPLPAPSKSMQAPHYSYCTYRYPKPSSSTSTGPTGPRTPQDVRRDASRKTPSRVSFPPESSLMASRAKRSASVARDTYSNSDSEDDQTSRRPTAHAESPTIAHRTRAKSVEFRSFELKSALKRPSRATQRVTQHTEETATVESSEDEEGGSGSPLATTDSSFILARMCEDASTPQMAVATAMKEVFTHEEIVYGVATDKALGILEKLGNKERAFLLDQSKMRDVYKLVRKWREEKLGLLEEARSEFTMSDMLRMCRTVKKTARTKRGLSGARVSAGPKKRRTSK